MHALRRTLPLVLVSSSALAAAQGNVLIVGPGGFSQIQSAVLAASVVTVLDSVF
jgi:hypothetical protein